MDPRHRQDDRSQPSSQQQQVPQQLTQEEQRILQECNRESFIRRSFPLSILSGFAVLAAGRQGLIKPSPNYGFGPKIAVGAICGYFLGKFSYVNECADKFLTQAPDSNIAKAIRKKRGMPPRETEGAGPTTTVARESWEQEQEQEQGQGQGRLEEDREEKPGGTSYDELRRQHREQARQQQMLGRLPTSQSPGTSSQQQQQLQQQQQQQQEQGRWPQQRRDEDDPMWAPPSKMRKKPTNKYGDEGFE